MSDIQKRLPGFAKFSLGCLFATVMLILLHTYLDGWAPYREILRFPKDRIEAIVLGVAACVALFGFVLGIVSCFLIKTSQGRLRGFWWAALSVAMNAAFCFGAIVGICFKRWGS